MAKAPRCNQSVNSNEEREQGLDWGTAVLHQRCFKCSGVMEYWMTQQLLDCYKLP